MVKFKAKGLAKVGKVVKHTSQTLGKKVVDKGLGNLTGGALTTGQIRKIAKEKNVSKKFKRIGNLAADSALRLGTHGAVGMKDVYSGKRVLNKAAKGDWKGAGKELGKEILDKTTQGQISMGDVHRAYKLRNHPAALAKFAGEKAAGKFLHDNTQGIADYHTVRTLQQRNGIQKAMGDIANKAIDKGIEQGVEYAMG